MDLKQYINFMGQADCNSLTPGSLSYQQMPNLHEQKITEKILNRKPRYKKSAIVKQLEQMVLEDDRRRHPLIPPQYVASTAFRDDSIIGLKRCILAFLRLSGHHADRSSNTGKMIDNRMTFEDVVGRKRTIGSIYRMPGTSNNEPWDISATIFKRQVRIKAEIGLHIPSQAHKNFQRAMETNGGIYVIATSFEQFKNWYDSNFGEDML